MRKDIRKKREGDEPIELYCASESVDWHTTGRADVVKKNGLEVSFEAVS